MLLTLREFATLPGALLVLGALIAGVWLLTKEVRDASARIDADLEEMDAAGPVGPSVAPSGPGLADIRTEAEIRVGHDTHGALYGNVVFHHKICSLIVARALHQIADDMVARHPKGRCQ